MNVCKLSGHKSFDTTAPSIISCSLICARDGSCLLFAYNTSDGKCVSYDASRSICGSLATAVPGWSVLFLELSSCLDIKTSRTGATDGVYTIFPTRENGIQVYCDMTTEGGGWTVFQRRFNGSVIFYRDWEEYKRGFGYPAGEYWLGNDHLHELTKSGSCKLRINLVSFLDEDGYAEFSNFTIGSEEEGYVLNFSQFVGTVVDALSYHKEQKFSTKDNDNDAHSDGNCAERWHGAWWYNNCHHSNLNGEYGESGHESMWWGNWETEEVFGSTKMTRMMIRC